MSSVEKTTIAPATTAGSSSGATWASFFAITSARERSRAWRALAEGLLVFDAGMGFRVSPAAPGNPTAGVEPGSIGPARTTGRPCALAHTTDNPRGAAMTFNDQNRPDERHPGPQQPGWGIPLAIGAVVIAAA